LIIVVGKESPGTLRDFGACYSTGEVLAFIDADAYPSKDWVDVALRYMTDFALGGPSLLPPDSNFRQRLTDLVYRYLPLSYRVKPTRPMFVKEMPTSNLFVKKRRFFEVGGFDCDCLTGEDSILCAKLGGCLYIPSLIVYHRRRPIFHPLFKQVAVYGRQRGIFFRAYVGTLWNYGRSFVCGFFTCRPVILNKGKGKRKG